MVSHLCFHCHFQNSSCSLRNSHLPNVQRTEQAPLHERHMCCRLSPYSSGCVAKDSDMKKLDLCKAFNPINHDHQKLHYSIFPSLWVATLYAITNLQRISGYTACIQISLLLVRYNRYFDTTHLVKLNHQTEPQHLPVLPLVITDKRDKSDDHNQ